MTSRKGNQPATKAGNGAVHKQPNVKKLPYASRYVAVDSHLVERKSSSDLVSALAGERPAGRKLAQDIANACNQLAGEGYEVFSIVPTVAGRIVEVFMDEDETESEGQPQEPSRNSVPEFVRPVPINLGAPAKPAVEEDEPLAVGYSVTDGMIITAKLRE